MIFLRYGDFEPLFIPKCAQFDMNKLKKAVNLNTYTHTIWLKNYL